MLGKWITKYAKAITAAVAGAGAVLTIAYGPDKSEHWIALVWALLGAFGVYQIPNHDDATAHPVVPIRNDAGEEYKP